jgi:hypothetical protein
MTSPGCTRSPSFAPTESAGSESWLVMATFCNGAITPEIVAVACTVATFAATVGIGFGDGALRV